MAQSKNKKHATQHSTAQHIVCQLAKHTRVQASQAALYSFSENFTFDTTRYYIHFMCALSGQSFCPVSQVVFTSLWDSSRVFPLLMHRICSFQYGLSALSWSSNSLFCEAVHDFFCVYRNSIALCVLLFLQLVLLESRCSRFVHAFICIRTCWRALVRP